MLIRATFSVFVIIDPSVVYQDSKFDVNGRHFDLLWQDFFLSRSKQKHIYDAKL